MDPEDLISSLSSSQPLRHLPLLTQVHPDIYPRLDPLEAGVHDAQQLQGGEGPPRQRPQDMGLLGGH